MVASYATCQAPWIKMLLEELKIIEPMKVKLFVYNKSSFDLENNPVCHGQSKHIERRYYFLMDQVNKGKLELENCKTKCQLAITLTKPLKKVRFDELNRSTEMRSLENMS